MKKSLIRRFLFLLLFLKLNNAFSQAAEVVPADSLKTPETHRFGFMDFNGYYDNRGGSTFTINYLAILNKRLSYFSFINYQQGGFEVKNLNDFDFFYSEHNLTYSPFNKIPIDINVQAVLISGEKNDKLRLAPSLEVRNRGAAILLLSEDLDEIIELSDRIGVIFNGSIIYEANAEDLDISVLGEKMAGH